MGALPDDFAKVRESLAELRLRFPAAAMDGLDQVLDAYLELLREGDDSDSRVERGSDADGARQSALWAVRRALLRFFPSNRVERDGDDCSPAARAAYAGFALALSKQARREGDAAEAVVSELILEWLDMLEVDRESPRQHRASRVEWDLPHLARVVAGLERLFRPWLPHLRQQVFRVRWGAQGAAAQAAQSACAGVGARATMGPAQHA